MIKKTKTKNPLESTQMSMNIEWNSSGNSQAAMKTNHTQKSM